jgi:hypothetical protein
MSLLLDETGRIDEPSEVCLYSDLLTQVAANNKPIIVRRGGEDLAAIISLEHLELLLDLLWKMPEGAQDELLRDLLLLRKAEKMAARIDWEQARKSRPPQHWFDREEPKPF